MMVLLLQVGAETLSGLPAGDPVTMWRLLERTIDSESGSDASATSPASAHRRHALYALALLNRGNWTGAQAAAKAALADGSSSGEAWSVLGHAAAHLGWVQHPIMLGTSMSPPCDIIIAHSLAHTQLEANAGSHISAYTPATPSQAAHNDNVTESS